MRLTSILDTMRHTFLSRFSLSAFASIIGTALLCTTPVLHAQQLRNTDKLQSPPQANPAERRLADYIVAIVGGEPITNNEVRARLFRLEMQLLNLGAETPPRSEMLPEVLERLISERAQVQRAKEMGVTVDEGSVTQAVTDLTQSNTESAENVAARLRAEGVSEAQLRSLLRDELTLARLREREIRNVEITEAELEEFINEQERLTGISGPELIDVAQVLVPVDASASDADKTAAQARAQAIQTAAASGGNLKELAQAQSLDTSTAGGVGARPLDAYPELFAQAIAQLPAGSVTPVLQSGAGYHVLKVLSRKQGKSTGQGLVDTSIQTKAQHILLRADAKMTEQQAIEKLNALRAQIASGQLSFEEAAKQFSQDGSAVNGGDLGWSNPKDFVPEFEMEMNLLKPGEMSRPFISRYGVHVVKVNDRRVKQLSSIERRKVLVDALKEKKGQEKLIKWARDIRAQAYVEMRQPPAITPR